MAQLHTGCFSLSTHLIQPVISHNITYTKYSNLRSVRVGLGRDLPRQESRNPGRPTIALHRRAGFENGKGKQVTNKPTPALGGVYARIIAGNLLMTAGIAGIYLPAGTNYGSLAGSP